MWNGLLAGFAVTIWIVNGLLAQEAYDCLADRSAAAEARVAVEAERAAPPERLEPNAFDPTRPTTYRYTQYTENNIGETRKLSQKYSARPRLYHEPYTTIIADR